MDYEKMLFYANSSKMPQANSLAPPAPPTFRVGHSVAPSFLQLQPDSYATYADNFDLSLLPQDCGSPTDNIPTIVYQYTNDTPSTPPTPQIKIEQTWPCAAEDIKQEQSYALLYEQLNCHQQQQQHQAKSSSHQLIPPLGYRQSYPSPQSSPAQSEYSFPHTGYASCCESLSSSRSSLYPSSPCPSLDAASIKQELHILPPSPPESNCEAPSPHSSCADIKSEPIDADVETLIDLNSLFEKTFNDLAAKRQQASPPPPATATRAQQQQQQQDHQLLREYLEDTTFQRKHNLKPLALDSFIGGLEEVRSDIEPVISLALEHAKREADETCAKLQISQDPSAWSPVQVHAWLRSTIAQFKLPPIDNLESKFCEDGAALILLSAEEFTRRAPENGSTLHAQLEIWKMAYSENGYPCHDGAAQQQMTTTGEIGAMVASVMQLQQGMWQADCLPNLSMEAEDDSEDENDMLPSGSAAVNTLTITATAAANGNGNGTVNTAAAAAVEPKRVGATAGRNGGSHIHLWQFLKELLAAAHINGTAIRWIDRNKGIFKIEDSVRVAKLWGRRKNRPAMNYDKLSRSIRQYYKKGIMKKTERSQRLVYQFCHPYHL